MGLLRSSYKMVWLRAFIIVQFFGPSKSDLFNKTYGNLEFIYPEPTSTASFFSARSWCNQHGSTLAEITSEHIWKHFVKFLNEFGLDREHIILNANVKELPAWQWITGETFPFRLRNDAGMYARLAKQENSVLSIKNSLPNWIIGCDNSYVCEHARNWSCSGQDNNSISLDGNCYVFHHDERVNWFEAYYGCEKNSGKLATFKHLKQNAERIMGQLQNGREYWIGLYRQEWRWTDSNELLSYSNWGKSYPDSSHSCVYAHSGSKKWFGLEKCNASAFTFACIRHISKCTNNSCHNGVTCADSVDHYTCHCAPGFTGSDCQTDINECRNGSICLDSVSHYTRVSVLRDSRGCSVTQTSAHVKTIPVKMEPAVLTRSIITYVSVRLGSKDRSVK